MPKENLSVSLPPKIRSMVDREAKRGKRSRSAVVSDALRLYFNLRQIPREIPAADERAAIAIGRRAHAKGEIVTLREWRNAMGIGDH
jgi:metal-responsive CopG/Arc/MetJ family transcriptional regulator